MNPAWDYFWPALAAGLVIGAIAGSLAFRKARPRNSLLAGLALTLAAVAAWHWPLGAADRFATRVQAYSRIALDNWEMTQVQSQLGRRPLSRQLLLSGPADDFQRSELARIMSNVPGVGRATWSREDRAVPLIAEGAAAAFLGFLAGLLLAYLVRLHRRHNAQWNW
jgi:hypothetical protein